MIPKLELEVSRVCIPRELADLFVTEEVFVVFEHGHAVGWGGVRVGSNISSLFIWSPLE